MVKSNSIFKMFLLTSALVLGACNDSDDPVEVSSISVSGGASIDVGATQQLSATVEPTDAEDKSLMWSSSNSSVATVDGSGLVTAVAEGTTTITATNDESGVSGTASITVTTPIIEVTEIDLGATFTLVAQSTQQLTAAVTPADATDMTVAYSSSDDSVATVDSSGLVTAIAAGTATITATNDASGVTGEVAVTVTPLIINVTAIDLGAAVMVDVATTTQLTATHTPANATDMTVTYTSSDDAIATVSDTGLVTGVAVGTATITASNAASGITGTVEITVEAVEVLATSIDLGADFTVDKMATNQLVATVLPTDTTDAALTYTSSDDSVATVSASGEVVGVMYGSATITATNAASGITGMVDVMVDGDMVVAVVAQKWDLPAHSSDDYVTASGITYKHMDGPWEDTPADAEIANTEEDGLYVGETAGTNVNLTFDLPNETYDVTLHLAEIWHDGGGRGGVGERVYDISVEGAVIESALDLFETVGLKSAHDIKTSVDLTDGQLNVDMAATAGNAKLSAILISRTLSAMGDEDADMVMNYMDNCLGTASDATVDDMGCATVVAAPTSVFSMDFEGTSMAPLETTWDNAGTATLSADASNGTGTQGLIVDTTNGKVGLTVKPAQFTAGEFVPGDTYVISFDVKRIQGTAGAGFGRLFNYDGSNWLGTSNVGHDSAGTDWTHAEVELTVPDTWTTENTSFDVFFMPVPADHTDDVALIWHVDNLTVVAK